MNNDYDIIEEDLKKKTESKKEVKKSGRSIFKLQDIIKEKSIRQEKKSQEEDGKDSKTLAEE